MSESRENAENAYRAWLEAARKAAGTPQALNSFVAENLNRRSRNIDARIRGWTNPSTAKLPGSGDDREIIALAKAIENYSPQAPIEIENDLDIEGLIREVIRLRHENQLHGVKLTTTVQHLYDSEVLGLPVTTGSQLDMLRLNLGSAVFSGDLPPYTPREIDERLLDALNDPTVDVVTVIGPPKVGKTRSLVENLKSSTLKHRNIFWLRPGGDLALLIATLSPSDKSSTVIVIDDLQRWGHDLQKMTTHTMSQLKSRAKLLFTLHLSDFLKWRANLFDHSTNPLLSSQIVPSSGPSSGVLDEIEKNSIQLGSHLTERELELARGVLPHLEPAKLVNLGAYFSSLEYLQRTMKALAKSDDPFTEALVGAIIDSRIMFPNGVMVDALEELTELELASLSPNLFFSRAKFEMLMSDVFTRGASTDSPHSILQRTPENPRSFSLFESLWEELKPKSWQAPTNIVSAKNALVFAENIAEAGYPEEVLKVLKAHPEIEDGPYCLQIALAYSELHQEKQEEEWYLKGISHNHAQSMFHYAYFLENIDEAKAKRYYKSAADLGDLDSMFNLALIVEKNDPALARDLYEKASASGLREAMNNLAKLIEVEEPEYAIELYRKSSELGNALATFNLALSIANSNIDEAIELYAKLAKGGDPESMNNLAVLLWDSDPIESEKLLRLSADLGNARAMFNLAKMFEDLDPEESNRHLSQAADLKYAPAIYVQGLNLRDEGDWEDSIERFELAASLGDSASMFELGKMFDGTDTERAVRMLRRAADLGETKAKVNLGFHLEEQNLEESLRLYQEASNEGDPRAKANLARLIEDTQPDKALALLKESSNQNDSYGCLLLGIRLLENEPATARTLFEIAVSDDQPGSWYWLGVSWERENMDSAITCYENALEIDKMSDAATRLGEIFEQIDPDRSLAYLDRAISLGDEEAVAIRARVEATAKETAKSPRVKANRSSNSEQEGDSANQIKAPSKKRKKISN